MMWTKELLRVLFLTPLFIYDLNNYSLVYMIYK